MHHPDLAVEQAFIDLAYQRLDAMRAAASEALRAALTQVPAGTHQSLVERDVMVHNNLQRLSRLELGAESLCFGRIDRETGESFHIGRLAVSDENHEPLVIDWRAPAAEPFYRATGRQPLGLRRRRHFLTEGRRLLDIEDELFGGTQGEELGLAGSSALRAALERSRTGRMRDIVATVQREQDEIIRAPLPGLLVVQGGPGTGKTAVALHRAAYLLYTHRFPLERQGVLVIGPNRLFMRYIEHVLPSLGESGIDMSTIGGLVKDVEATDSDDAATAHLKGDARMSRVIARAVRDRQRPLREEVVVGFGPFVLHLRPEESADIVRATRRRPAPHNPRRSLVERLLFQRLFDHYQAAVARNRRLGLRPRPENETGLGDSPSQRPMATAGGDGQLAQVIPFDVRSRSRSGGDLEPRQTGVEEPAQELAEKTEAVVPFTRGEAAEVDDAMAVSGDPEAEFPLTVADLTRAIRRDPAIVAALERMWPVLTPAQLLRDLFGSPALVASASAGVLSAEEQRALHRPRGSSEAAIQWSPADLPLLDEAAALLGPAQRRPGHEAEPADVRERRFGHIVVDEAQDLTPMQLRMLARRSLSGSMTLVGDVAQATGPWAPKGWDDVLAHLPTRRGTKVVELSVNYRTPTEVMELAGSVLAAAIPGARLPESIRSTGEPPRVVAVATLEQLGAAAAQTAEQELRAVGEGIVAVICPPSLEPQLATTLAAKHLEFGQELRRGLDLPITLLPVELVKGLEFDSVVVIEPARLVREATAGLQALYVALTRTTRRLALVHADPLPQVLDSAEVNGRSVGKRDTNGGPESG